MEKTNNLKKLYEKLQREYQEYIEELKELPIEKIIDKSYETACKEEFIKLFTVEYRYNDREIIALMKLNNTLEYLYQDWFKSEGGIHTVLEGNIKNSISKVVAEQFKNDNPKLIGTISKLLQELDNYDRCYRLKSIYHVVDFNEQEISDLLNTNSIRILNDFFNDVKEDEHIQYLVEIQVFNSDLYDEIERKILPKLDEFINGTSKEYQKKEREAER